ncbi:unnamed protein product [Cunninghamella echinulata]
MTRSFDQGDEEYLGMTNRSKFLSISTITLHDFFFPFWAWFCATGAKTPRCKKHQGAKNTKVQKTPRCKKHQGAKNTKVQKTPRCKKHQGAKTPRCQNHQGAKTPKCFCSLSSLS